MVPCCVSDVRLASVTRGTVFRDAEVHQLGAGARQHDVRGLHVPVDDPVAMRVIERIGHFDRALKRAIERQRPLREACREGVPLEVLHDDEVDAIAGADVVQRADVRVSERCAGLCLAAEALAQARIDAVGGRQNLDGDGSIEPGVDGAEDLSHAAFTHESIDLIGSERSPRCERGRRLHQVRRGAPDGAIDEPRLVLLGQERLDLAAHVGVAAAGPVDECATRGRLLVEHLLVQSRDLFPPFAVHRFRQALGLNLRTPVLCALPSPP